MTGAPPETKVDALRELVEEFSHKVTDHIDAMYPGMWNGIPKSARVSIRNTVINGVGELLKLHLTLAQAAAYERAAQLCDELAANCRNNKEIYSKSGMELNECANELADAALRNRARTIRALGSASALELALAQARQEVWEECVDATCELCRTEGWPINDEHGKLFHIHKSKPGARPCAAEYLFNIPSRTPASQP